MGEFLDFIPYLIISKSKFQEPNFNYLLDYLLKSTHRKDVF